MPAAAVIPALIAYIKVVAVKKLVVGSVSRTVGTPPVGANWRAAGRPAGGASRWWCFRAPSAGADSIPLRCSLLSVEVGRHVYFEQIRVLKAGWIRLDNFAWNNGIGPRFYFVGFRSQR